MAKLSAPKKNQPKKLFDLDEMSETKNAKSQNVQSESQSAFFREKTIIDGQK